MFKLLWCRKGYVFNLSLYRNGKWQVTMIHPLTPLIKFSLQIETSPVGMHNPTMISNGRVQDISMHKNRNRSKTILLETSKACIAIFLRVHGHFQIKITDGNFQTVPLKD